MAAERSKIFTELQERREQQLSGLEQAFKKSFREYWEDRKKKDGKGQYPDLETDRDVDNYLLARTILSDSVHRMDMVLRDVARVALKVLEELKREGQGEETEK